MKRLDTTIIKKLEMIIHGTVQGIGFRPFIYRLAHGYGLKGWVKNSPQGVEIEAEGTEESLKKFLAAIEKDKPKLAAIEKIETKFLEPAGYQDFRILESSEEGEKTVSVLADIATCAECLAEILDPKNRRYLYPFTNCTNCGPRFSIIEALPYDRANTTMKQFTMCAACRSEYEDPADRRFHAEPNACGVCGPELELWSAVGVGFARKNEALVRACEAIRHGKIVAVKGIGGYLLVCDARNSEAVKKLRERKHREEKPLAVMAPSMEWIKSNCEVSEVEEGLLNSSQAPIVLLKTLDSGFRRNDKQSEIASSGCAVLATTVVPGNPYLGVMLPYTPLHYLMMKNLNFPVVATSGNLSDEPIAIDEHEAIERLGAIADFFLVHNRPIARYVDDSIVREMCGREMVIRRARGYAPMAMPIKVPGTFSSKRCLAPLLAVGAHLKNTVAVTNGSQIILSQHIGDLDTEPAVAGFRQTLASLKKLYEVTPSSVISDLHPDYVSTNFALSTRLPHTQVQHHYAHVLACMADNEIEGPALGVAWDGTGYGTDDTIWGGEFLLVNEEGYKRFGHFRTFPLAGGDKAAREPRRSALGLLYAIFGDSLFMLKDFEPLEMFTNKELTLMRSVFKQRINVIDTSSAGRLFDAVASMIGIRHAAKFEGQAAMDLEFAAMKAKTDECYVTSVTDVFDWEPMIFAILFDLQTGVTKEIIAAKFHNTLAEVIVAFASKSGEKKIVLSGGCFQNKYLTERAVSRLIEEGFEPFWHRRVPTNDGGIALGQIAAVIREENHGHIRRAGTPRHEAALGLPS